MSAVAICEERVRERGPSDSRTGVKLGQILTRAHEDVLSHGAGDCPVCGRSMRRAASEARCDDCGARLL